MHFGVCLWFNVSLMNKGKVRDNEQLKWKMVLIQRILALDGRHIKSDFARRLMGKSGKELQRILIGRLGQ